MEKEKNISSSGNTFDFGARVYDSGFPTFLSRDPYEFEYQGQSTYLISQNNPILKIDMNGEWAWVANRWLQRYGSELELYNGQFATERVGGMNTIKLSIFLSGKIQNKLNSYQRNWDNPNSKNYSPVFASILKKKELM